MMLDYADNKSSLELQIIISVIMLLANVAIVGTVASGFRGNGERGDGHGDEELAATRAWIANGFGRLQGDPKRLTRGTSPSHPRVVSESIGC